MDVPPSKHFVQLKDKMIDQGLTNLLQIPIQMQRQSFKGFQNIYLDFFQHFLNHLARNYSNDHLFLFFIGNLHPPQRAQQQLLFQEILSKKAWGRHNESSFKKVFNFFASWQQKLFTITPHSVYFSNPYSLQIEDTFVYTSNFHFQYGKNTGNFLGITIQSSHRVLNIDTKDIIIFYLFIRFLSQALQKSDATKIHRFQSFAKIRQNCGAKAYIDGQGYFGDLYDSLMSAKKQVYITGWMLSPYFSLKRPDLDYQYRIDNVLLKLAQSGVKISIILYLAPQMALNIDSQFSQSYLMRLNSNIKVFLHPNYVLIPFLWSHHQKIVIVDQKIAYLGGLDIGYGRFDNQQHSLLEKKDKKWEGMDYCNYRIRDITKPKQYKKCSLDRNNQVRMPWHDIGVRLVGNSVVDLSQHFIQYWNHVNFQLDMSDRQLLVYAGVKQLQQDVRQQKQQNKQQKIQQIINNRKAYNVSIADTKQTDQPYFQWLHQTPRSSKSQFFPVVSFEQDPATHLQSTISVSVISEKVRQIDYYKSYINEHKLKTFLNKYHPKNIFNHLTPNITQYKELSSTQHQINTKRKQNHQILRSASMWSLGLGQDMTQQSILNAYIDLIQNANQFIYIENQFFISQINKITKTIIKRILKAFKQKKQFKVVIVLPALPGFDGHPADQNSAVFRIQVHLNFSNVRYMYEKLLEKIKSQAILDQYLLVISLRTHCLLNNKPVTQIIYVHSKMIIADDRRVIIGSANINDRSMLGDRDSQIAVLIQDQQLEQVVYTQGKRIVCSFAHNLRKQLYIQHFGIKQKEAQDYLNEDVWYYITQTAVKNHNIYRQIFGCFPDNQMTNFDLMKKIQEQANPLSYQLLSKAITGHAIPFQRQFLKQQDLTFKASQKQYFIPQISFT